MAIDNSIPAPGGDVSASGGVHAVQPALVSLATQADSTAAAKKPGKRSAKSAKVARAPRSRSRSPSPKQARWRSSSPRRGQRRSGSPGGGRRMMRDPSPGPPGFRLGAPGPPLMRTGFMRNVAACVAPRWVTESSLRPDVRQRFESFFARGLIHAADLDPACVGFLEGLSGLGAMQVLEEFGNLDLFRIRNLTAFFIGICKRVATREPPHMGPRMMRPDSPPLRRRQGLGAPGHLGLTPGAYPPGPGPHSFGMAMTASAGLGSGFGPRFSCSRSRSPLRYAPGRSPTSRGALSRSPPPRFGRPSPRYSRSPPLRYNRASPRYNRSPGHGSGSRSRSPVRRRGVSRGASRSRSPLRSPIKSSPRTLPGNHTRREASHAAMVAVSPSAVPAPSTPTDTTMAAIPAAGDVWCSGGPAAAVKPTPAVASTHERTKAKQPGVAAPDGKANVGMGGRKDGKGSKDSGDAKLLDMGKQGAGGRTTTPRLVTSTAKASNAPPTKPPPATLGLANGPPLLAGSTAVNGTATFGAELRSLFELPALMEPLSAASATIPIVAISFGQDTIGGGKQEYGYDSGGPLQRAVLQVVRNQLDGMAESAGVMSPRIDAAELVVNKVLTTLPNNGANSLYDSEQGAMLFMTKERQIKIEQLTESCSRMWALAEHSTSTI